MVVWAWLVLSAAVILLPRREATAVRVRTLRAQTAARAGTKTFNRTGDGYVRRNHRAAGTNRLHARAAVGASIALAVAVATASSGRPVVGLSVGLVVAVTASALNQALRGRSMRVQRRDLRSALRLLEAELTAGSRESEALLAASGMGSTGEGFRRAAAVAGVGGDVAAVFASIGQTLATGRPGRPGPSHADFAPLAAAWHVRSRCGAALADLVGHVENDLSAADDRWREADAAMAGPRSSAVLLAGLPIVGLALGTAIGAHPLGWLFGTTPGAILLLVGVLFDAAGWLWMQRLVRSGLPGSGR
ncbi:MAG: hypothetical protein JWM76_2368 [Pseudonocardiales bacterium]|nr:hypothetical protein [Pseudonocardiales bacterium]